MHSIKTTGTLKSLTYVAMLTFFVPAGAFYLSYGFFAVTAEAGQTVSHYFTPEVSVERVVTVCPDVNDDII